MTIRDNEVKIILDQSLNVLSKGDYKTGRDMLENVLDDPGCHEYYIRNNLSSVYCYLNNYVKAYEVLKPNLNVYSKHNPYLFALYATILHTNGEVKTAVKMFRKSVELYIRESKYVLPKNWEAYALLIMQAGAITGSYKQTLNFYQKHGKHWDKTQIHNIASRVAINLKRYEQALIYSKKANTPACDNLIKAIQGDVIPWCEFVYRIEDVFKSEVNEKAIQSPTMLMLNLQAIFDEHYTELEKEQLVYHIATKSDDWGELFAFKMIEKDFFSYKLKMKALDALVEIGVIRSGERVKTVIDGKEIEMMSGFVHILPDDLISMGIENEVEALQKKGLLNEALILLQERTMTIGFTSPALMKISAKLYEDNGLKETSDHVLKLLDEYMKQVNQ